MKNKAAHTVMVLQDQYRSKKMNMLCALGYFFRCALAFLCAFGFSDFVLNSIGADVSAGFVLIASAASCLLLIVMERNIKLFFFGATALIAGIAYIVTACGGLKSTVSGIVVAIYNSCAAKLEALGYRGIGTLISAAERSSDAGIKSEHEMLCIGSALFIFLICAAFVFLTVRKVYLLPIIFTVITFLTFIFFFGMGDNDFSFALALSAFCGIVALSRYDAVFAKKAAISSALGVSGKSASASVEIEQAMNTNTMLGGFTGFFAALLAFLIILIPSRISVSMNDIPQISTPLQKAEQYLLSLIGKDGSYNASLNAVAKLADRPRTATAASRSYTDRIYAELGSDTDTPIYLRSWIGTSYANDSWSIASESQIRDYRQIFGAGFSPELLTAELLTAVDPRLTQPDNAPLTDKLGYTVSQIHYKSYNSHTDLLLLPSYTDPRRGLQKYGTSESLSPNLINYYEGIFTSAQASSHEQYTVTALIPHGVDSTDIRGISEFVDYYTNQFELISPIRTLISSGADRQTAVRQYEKLSNTPTHSADSYSVFTPPSKEDSLSYRYVYEMTPDEQAKINAVIDNIPLYDKYVNSNYLGLCEESEKFAELMNSIADSKRIPSGSAAESFTDRHRTVEAVIDYLSSNVKYTLSPKSPSADRKYVNAAETLLFDTREGYCVQYATAAAMLLRSIGIPVRYAEGYIAADFVQNPIDSSFCKYTASIPDSNAHSWIEVFYDGFGWIRYEVTAPYASGNASHDIPQNTARDEYSSPSPQYYPVRDETQHSAYSSDITAESTTKTAVTASAGTDSRAFESTEKPEKAGENNTAGSSSTGIIIIALLCLLSAVIIIVIIWLSTAKKNDLHQHELYNTACSAKLTAEDALKCAVEINAMTAKLLEYLHFTPNPGELAGDFAARVDLALQDKLHLKFRDITPAQQACEFSTSITADELHKMAEYCNALYKFAAENNGRLNGIYVKYFLSLS